MSSNQVFTTSDAPAGLKAGEAGVALSELTRKHGISRATYFNWRAKYGGVSVSELKRMKELEAENAKLKRTYAELALENAKSGRRVETEVTESSLDRHAWTVHDLCMATKTISIEIDAYELLVREKRDPKESFSRVIRRVLSERPARTAGDLLAAMEAFQGKGAGSRRRRDRNAAA